MGKGIRTPGAAQGLQRVSLGELIHQHVRGAIEAAVHEELQAVLGALPHERSATRRGYRNGTKVRTLGRTEWARRAFGTACDLVRRDGVELGDPSRATNGDWR